VVNLEGSWFLMPLVDLLNHHPDGAGFLSDASAINVAVAQPGTDGECFACYGGHRDVLDLALLYGYVDRQTPFASCGPLDFDIAGLGRLRVAARRGQVLHPLDPPEVTYEEGGMTLSHLTCDRRSPRRSQTVLRLALLGMARKQGIGRERAELALVHAVDAILGANLRLLRDLQQAAEPLVSSVPVAALVSEAAALQAGILREVLTIRV
jgi:hypothetical protein